jgi:SAM-dependent methyltransferase
VTGLFPAPTRPGRPRTADRRDPFRVLGLEPRADLADDEVHAAWRRIASATHPDREDGGDLPRFAEAAAAYTVLRTRSGRGEALADLRATPPAADRAGWRRRVPAAGLTGRVMRGRPARLALRTLIAAAAGLGAVVAAGPHPAAPALVTGIVTWLVLTGRHDLAPAEPRAGGPRRPVRWQDQLQEGEKVPQRPATPADDPYGGREPTSHERRSGQPWDASYHDGPAPWDTGHPQPAIVRLAARGGFAGAVLDAGCGTGENALYLASLGLPVVGFDIAETAVAMAREKASDRGIEAEFGVADAFRLDRLRRTFDTVLDCGLFHSLEGDERPRYAASLASVTAHDGTLYVLCFSDDGPGTGPHPVSQEDLRAAFNRRNGWHVTAIEPDRVQTRYHDENGAPAWLATVKRI